MAGGRPQSSDSRNRNGDKIELSNIPIGARVENPPEPPEGHGLDEEGRRRWDRCWSTAVATMWVDGDIDVVLRLCQVHQEWSESRGPVSLLSELRHLEMLLGLSPRSRRELRWRLVDGAGVVEENGVRVASDRRGRLRVVDDQAG
jgi:hypothetical protein